MTGITGVKTTKFPSAGSKFQDFWRGDSGEMECGSVSDYSDFNVTTASSSQNLVTDGLLLLVKCHNPPV